MQDDDIDRWWRARERGETDGYVDRDELDDPASEDLRPRTHFVCSRCGSDVGASDDRCSNCGVCYGCG